MPFEAEDSMVGGPSVLAGIVADRGQLLMAVDGEHGPVQVQDGMAASPADSDRAV